MALFNNGRDESFDSSVFEKVMEYGAESGEAHMMFELLKIFFETTPGRLVKLEKAVEEQDVNTVQIVAHSLKSSCAYVGAKRMRTLCLELEQMCQFQSVVGMNTLIEKIKAEFDQVKVMLEQMVVDYVAH